MKTFYLFTWSYMKRFLLLQNLEVEHLFPAYQITPVLPSNCFCQQGNEVIAVWRHPCCNSVRECGKAEDVVFKDLSQRGNSAQM